MPKRRGHGEGSIFQRHTPDCPPPDDNGERPKHNCKGRWVGTVDLGMVAGQRKRKTLYGRTRKEVAIKVQAAMAAKQQGTLTVGRMTVEMWMAHWLDVVCVERGLKTASIRAYRNKTDRWIIPNIGQLRLERLHPDHLRGLYASMAAQGASDSMKTQVHTILRIALHAAVKERRASYNAATLMEPPRSVKGSRADKALPLEDARKVLAAAGDDPRWFLALYLGLRQGEVLALHWSDVDLHAKEIQVSRSLAIATDRSLYFETPKTDLSQTVMPLPTVVASRLAVLHAKQGAPRDGLIFHRDDGRPIHPRADWQAWKDLLIKADVPHVPLHAARNTTATLLKSLGVSPEDIRDVLRHSTLAMSDHYQGQVLSRKRDAVAALESALTSEL